MHLDSRALAEGLGIDHADLVSIVLQLPCASYPTVVFDPSYGTFYTSVLDGKLVARSKLTDGRVVYNPTRYQLSEDVCMLWFHVMDPSCPYAVGDYFVVFFSGGRVVPEEDEAVSGALAAFSVLNVLGNLR